MKNQYKFNIRDKGYVVLKRYIYEVTILEILIKENGVIRYGCDTRMGSNYSHEWIDENKIFINKQDALNECCQEILTN